MYVTQLSSIVENGFLFIDTSWKCRLLKSKLGWIIFITFQKDCIHPFENWIRISKSYPGYWLFWLLFTFLVIVLYHKTKWKILVIYFQMNVLFSMPFSSLTLSVSANPRYLYTLVTLIKKKKKSFNIKI